MNRFFLNAMLVADLGTGTFQRLPLPENGDLSVLAELFPKDVVIAAGRLSGSYAPSSCVLAVYADGKGAIVKGHTAPALRRCGLDAVVLKGYASSPCGLVVDGIVGGPRYQLVQIVVALGIGQPLSHFFKVFARWAKIQFILLRIVHLVCSLM